MGSYYSIKDTTTTKPIQFIGLMRGCHVKKNRAVLDMNPHVISYSSFSGKFTVKKDAGALTQHSGQNRTRFEGPAVLSGAPAAAGALGVGHTDPTAGQTDPGLCHSARLNSTDAF